MDNIDKNPRSSVFSMFFLLYWFYFLSSLVLTFLIGLLLGTDVFSVQKMVYYTAWYPILSDYSFQTYFTIFSLDKSSDWIRKHSHHCLLFALLKKKVSFVTLNKSSYWINHRIGYFKTTWYFKLMSLLTDGAGYFWVSGHILFCSTLPY